MKRNKDIVAVFEEFIERPWPLTEDADFDSTEFRYHAIGILEHDEVDTLMGHFGWKRTEEDESEEDESEDSVLCIFIDLDVENEFEDPEFSTDEEENHDMPGQLLSIWTPTSDGMPGRTLVISTEIVANNFRNVD
jgi:hypothetical protein